jgi:AI-2 transport protein TqsA
LAPECSDDIHVNYQMSFLLIYFILLFLDVGYPFLWAFIAFGMNYVPNIGSLIAAIPAVLLALVERGAWTAVWVAAGYIVVNNVIGNVIEPRFMGNKLGLSPLIVFLSLIFWGWLLGPVGMFLSVPMTMAAKLIFDSNEKTKWAGAILGP